MFGFDCYDRDGRRIDVETYGRLHVDPLYKIVARDEVGPYLVSTVWLGVDHGLDGGRPVIFETMTFAHGGGEDLGPEVDVRRYSTETEARQGHAETVAIVRATYDPGPLLAAPERTETPGPE